ncbi:MAG: OmpA family protein, partial [candidate division WOR-3 bacterium]
ILTMHPEIEVEIQGHTDDIGADAYNLKLSQKRAEAVRDYLINKHMIEPVRLIPVGYGERRPIADNSTEEGRRKNRRVEFLILHEKE